MIKKISLRAFNIFLFSIVLVIVGNLLFFQYKNAKNIIIDYFSKKEVSKTLNLQKILKTLFTDKIVILLNKQKANFYTYKIKNFNFNPISNKYDRLYIDYMKDKIKSVNHYSSPILIDPLNLRFVRFYFNKKENNLSIKVYFVNLKKDLEKILELSHIYIKNIKLFCYNKNLLLELTPKKTLNIDSLKKLKVFSIQNKNFLEKIFNKKLHKFKTVETSFKWNDNYLAVLSIDTINPDYKVLLYTGYSLNGLHSSVKQTFNAFILEIFILIIGFLIVYFLLIKRLSELFIKLAKRMKEGKLCTKCKSYIKELDDLQISYNKLYKTLKEEAKKNKALLELNKRFVVDTIHQIRTPIGVIVLNLDLLKMMLEDKEVNDIIEEIDAAVTMLSNSYEDLAYVSSNDTLDYKPTKINISNLTKERVEFFNIIAKVNDKKLIANIEEGLEYFINKIEFERITDNNISNAIKYSTGEDIFINLFKRDENIYFEVASYGAPIKNRKEIFEINYREQPHKRGLGIGLNIVKTICEKYGIKYRTYYRNRQNIFEYIFPIRK